MLLAGALVGILALSSCAVGDGDPTPSAPPPSSAPATPSPTATPEPTAAPALWPSGEVGVAAGALQSPWGLVVTDDVTLIGERDTGRILRLDPDGALTQIAMLDDVVHGGEGGLLGLALDDENRLYVASTGSDGNRVQRFALADDAGSLRESETVIAGLPSARNHNGGQVAFGPDGRLYVTVGDAGEPEAAQDAGSLAGKILRLNPDGTIPDDNPFPGSPVFSLGHRNVQGLAWTDDERMFASEFGQDTWDELNEIVPGGNYGWPAVEGTAGHPAYIDPVLQWPTSEASPSGLAVIGGSLVLANLRGQSLRVVPIADPQGQQVFFSGVYGRLRAVAVAPDGTLRILTNNTDGRGDPRPGDDLLLSASFVEGG
ncbi:PQQ-dependent sugar dehydrogenase [Microbacterium pseudoresistens]